MKKLCSFVALLGACASPTAFADELFVCIAVGVSAFGGDSNTVNGFGQTEAMARDAALAACYQRRNTSCQIVHCGRTTLDYASSGSLEGT